MKDSCIELKATEADNAANKPNHQLTFGSQKVDRNGVF